MAAAPGETSGRSEPIGLRVTPRLGILPEITRQTYESLAKAVREAIMNSIDAGSSVVHVDLSRCDEGILRVVDDGDGMDFASFRDSFLALGGSDRAPSNEKFGRIGIGSLALLGFGEVVHIRTRQAGAAGIEATVRLPGDAYLTPLEDLDLGAARIVPDLKSPALCEGAQHFTEIVVEGLDSRVTRDIQNVSTYYDFIDDLRRILPLPDPPDNHDLLRTLARVNGEVASHLTAISKQWSVKVVVHSGWHEAEVLTKRLYGESQSKDPWIGVPQPFDIRMPSSTGGDLVLIGYLVALPRADVDWAGLVTRVQNVAVTRSAFFGLESDPGFLRYVTGEVHVAGSFDKQGLVRIDRASFNETNPDYRSIQQAMQDLVHSFKISVPQRFQRRRSAARRICRQAQALAEELDLLERELSGLAPPGHKWRGLSGTRPKGWRDAEDLSPVRELSDLGLDVEVTTGDEPGVDLMLDGSDRVRLPHALAYPSLRCLGFLYAVRLVQRGSALPPLEVVNSPRVILINIDHPFVARTGLSPAARVLIGMHAGRDLAGARGRSALDWSSHLILGTSSAPRIL